MYVIKGLISALLVWIAVLSAYGFAWWSDPPASFASYQNGGRVILVVLIAGCAMGLLRLWAPPRQAPATR